MLHIDISFHPNSCTSYLSIIHPHTGGGKLPCKAWELTVLPKDTGWTRGTWDRNQRCDQWKMCALIQAVRRQKVQRNTAQHHYPKIESNVTLCHIWLSKFSIFSSIMIEADSIFSVWLSHYKSLLMASGYLGLRLILHLLMNTKIRIHVKTRVFSM